MFKTKLEKFVAKRSLIFFLILAILDIVLMKNRWYVLVGMMLGGIFSNLKFSSYAFVFSRIVASASGNSQHSNPIRNSLIIFIINQVVILPLLYIALKFNPWFFIGIVSGMLFVPILIFINCITEPLKITHNNFE